MSKRARRKLSIAQVTHEIRELIEQIISDSKAMPADWIANLVMKRHPRNGTTDFYYVCTSAFVRDEVRRQIGRFKERPESDPQLVLPGFKHLQKAYLIARDDRQVLVPVMAMTADERETKARDYEAMGYGCFAHADELRRYNNDIADAA